MSRVLCPDCGTSCEIVYADDYDFICRSCDSMPSIIKNLAHRYTTLIIEGKGQYIDEEYFEGLLGNMLDTLQDKAYIWPEDKLNRWIGFIQGVLFTEDLISIEEERNFSRPLFHEHYRRIGIKIPKSISFNHLLCR